MNLHFAPSFKRSDHEEVINLLLVCTPYMVGLEIVKGICHGLFGKATISEVSLVNHCVTSGLTKFKHDVQRLVLKAKKVPC